MLRLDTLKPKKGSRHRKKRVGRGYSSGWGQQAGRGHKGQLARTGGKITPGFEGGQTPLYRRVPKKGFKNFARVKAAILNVKDLEKLDPKNWPAINPETVRKDLVRGNWENLRILGDGELTKAFVVQAHFFSANAEEKIKKAGGQATRIEHPSLAEERKKEARSKKKTKRKSSPTSDSKPQS